MDKVRWRAPPPESGPRLLICDCRLLTPTAVVPRSSAFLPLHPPHPGRPQIRSPAQKIVYRHAEDPGPHARHRRAGNGRCQEDGSPVYGMQQ